MDGEKEIAHKSNVRKQFANNLKKIYRLFCNIDCDIDFCMLQKKRFIFSLHSHKMRV